MIFDTKIFDKNNFIIFTFDIDKVNLETLKATNEFLYPIFQGRYILLPNSFEVFPDADLLFYKKRIDEVIEKRGIKND